MNLKTRYSFLLFSILILDVLFLYYQTSNISISYHEIKILDSNHPFSYVINFLLDTFGKNDYVLRTPLIVLHSLSSLLLYKISLNYLRYQKDSIYLVVLFLALPLSTSASIFVDPANLVLFLLLLYIYTFQYANKYSEILLYMYLAVDVSFALLYLGLFFYSVVQRDKKLLIKSLLLFSTSMYYHGFDTGGVPKSHFVDNLGVYFAMFTPIVFIYIVYALFRRFKNYKDNVIWYISSSALIFSFLLSFRQNIQLQFFAPYLTISLPLVASVFFTSYRVRLPMYRTSYKIISYFGILFLFMLLMVSTFNKKLYIFYDQKDQHFAVRSHIAKELALNIKQNGFTCVYTQDPKMQERLSFYGISRCEKNLLSRTKSFENSYDVTVCYNKEKIKSYYVTKVRISK